jgi:hypothetical protein
MVARADRRAQHTREASAQRNGTAMVLQGRVQGYLAHKKQTERPIGRPAG